MSYSVINIDRETVNRISAHIKENANDTEYAIYVPHRSREILNGNILTVWEEMVSEEHKYPDFIREDGEAEKYFYQLNLSLEKFIEVNDEYKLDLEHLETPERTLTLDAFKAELIKAIFDDIASAWEDSLRNAITEITGKDPFSVDGVVFVSQNSPSKQ